MKTVGVELWNFKLYMVLLFYKKSQTGIFFCKFLADNQKGNSLYSPMTKNIYHQLWKLDKNCERSSVFKYSLPWAPMLKK